MSQVFHTQHTDAAFEPFELGNVQWLLRPGDNGNDALSSGIWKVTIDDTVDSLALRKT